MTQKPTIIITGAAKRLGRATALAFARRGCDLVLHYNQSAKEAKLLAARIAKDKQSNADVCLVQAELSVRKSPAKIIAATLERFGRIDHLINNASIFFPTPLVPGHKNTIQEPLTSKQLVSILRINSIQPSNLAALARSHLTKNHGSIVNLIDIYAEAGLSEHTAYVSAKSSLKAMTQQQAMDFAPDVRVNGVSPGAILWPDHIDNNENNVKVQHHLENKSLSEIVIQKQIIENTALKRLGQPENIAAAVVYLSLDAHYTTGSIINVDGGRRDYI